MKWKDGRKRKQLPIDGHLGKLCSLSSKHPVIICEAETGAGKSTRIPQAILLSRSQPVTAILPRRNACRWLAQRVAQELGSEPGQLVGWRLFHDSKLSAQTRLTFTVNQSLVNQIRRNKALPEGTLLIDEAHERSLMLDLLLGLIKKLIGRSPKTRVIISSATINAKLFAAYFDKAPLLSLKGRCFPVDVRPCRLKHSEHHSQGALRAAIEVMGQFLANELVVPTRQDTKTRVHKGTVIILLPGKRDIDNLSQSLHDQMRRFKRRPNKIQVYACHGGSTKREQDLVQTAVPMKTIRFVCATEVLRSSVTVPDTIGVIDSLQVKRLTRNQNGIGLLKKIAVSRAEAEQAKGRAGRLRGGFYIPVSYKDEYEKLPRWPEPAIKREPLKRIVLQVLATGYSLKSFRLITQPERSQITRAQQRLRLIQAIDERNKITDLGHQLAALPLDPEYGNCLLIANQRGVLAEAIIVVSYCHEEGFFARSFEAYGLEEEESDFSHIVSVYRMVTAEYQHYLSQQPKAQHAKRLRYMYQWCESRGIDYKKFMAVEQNVAEIADALQDTELALNHPIDTRRDYSHEALIKSLLPGFRDNIVMPVFDHRSSDGGHLAYLVGAVGQCESSYDLQGVVSESHAVMFASAQKLFKARRDADYRIRDIAVFPRSWLLETVPNLCRVLRETTIHYRPKQDGFVEHYQAVFYLNATQPEPWFKVAQCVRPVANSKVRCEESEYFAARVNPSVVMAAAQCVVTKSPNRSIILDTVQGQHTLLACSAQSPASTLTTQQTLNIRRPVASSRVSWRVVGASTYSPREDQLLGEHRLEIDNHDVGIRCLRSPSDVVTAPLADWVWSLLNATTPKPTISILKNSKVRTLLKDILAYQHKLKILKKYATEPLELYQNELAQLPTTLQTVLTGYCSFSELDKAKWAQLRQPIDHLKAVKKQFYSLPQSLNSERGRFPLTYTLDGITATAFVSQFEARGLMPLLLKPIPIGNNFLHTLNVRTTDSNGLVRELVRIRCAQPFQVATLQLPEAEQLPFIGSRWERSPNFQQIRHQLPKLIPNHLDEGEGPPQQLGGNHFLSPHHRKSIRRELTRIVALLSTSMYSIRERTMIRWAVTEQLLQACQSLADMDWVEKLVAEVGLYEVSWLCRIVRYLLAATKQLLQACRSLADMDWVENLVAEVGLYESSWFWRAANYLTGQEAITAQQYLEATLQEKRASSPEHEHRQVTSAAP